MVERWGECVGVLLSAGVRPSRARRWGLAVAGFGAGWSAERIAYEMAAMEGRVRTSRDAHQARRAGERRLGRTGGGG